MKIIQNTIHIGLETPVRVLHASDTHLTRADLRDGLRKVDLAASRAHCFAAAEECLAEISRVSHEMDVGVAAHLLGRRQVRRLPVVEKGRLCGMVSLGDIARWEACAMDAAEALSDIAGQMSDG